MSNKLITSNKTVGSMLIANYGLNIEVDGLQQVWPKIALAQK